MSSIERGKAVVTSMVDGLQQEIDEGNLLEAFKEYLVEKNYVSQDEKTSLADSAGQVCDALAARLGWSLLYTADVLFDFGTSSGMLDPDEDENDRMCHAQIHDWQRSGF